MHISGTGNNYLRLITIASFIIGTGLYVNPLTDIFSIHHSTDLVLIMTQLPKKSISWVCTGTSAATKKVTE